MSRLARLRLQWMDYYHSQGQNTALTCRHFGISRQSFYRWKRRYAPDDLRSLEDRSHRPHRPRQPTWTPELAERVLQLRQQYPRWGKDKVVVLLRRGLLVEPLPLRLKARRALWPRPYAVRKPRYYQPQAPGDLVQVDTLELRPLPGVIVKQFTARDVVSRWDVIEAHSRATASLAAQFLDTLQQRMPFPIRALQVDGGSEFAADFEQAYRDRRLKLLVLPPRSPKLDDRVERAQRTHTEEFYEVTPCSWLIPQLNQELRAWEHVYNTVCPHQALDYLTPQQFLLRANNQQKCH